MVDGREYAVPVGEMTELAEVVDALSNDIRKNGRFIASLKVDGCELEASEEWYRPRKLKGIRGIEVTTGLSAQLASDALKQGDRCLEELRSTLLRTVDFFRAGNDESGMKLFIELVTGLEWFVTTIKSVGDIMQVDFSTTVRNGIPLSEEVDAMNRILRDIIGSQERRDWVLLADLLEYELEPQMERWLDLLGVLRRIPT